MGLRIKDVASRFARDQKGTMAIMWGVSLSAVIFAVGSAYDYNKVHAARQNSLAAADMLAITAAVYIRDHGTPPATRSEGFKHNAKYYLEDFGIDLAPYDDYQAKYRWRKGKQQDLEAPNFKVKYDYPEDGQLTVFISGQSRPSFMGMIGIDNVDFSATSTVSYQVNDLKNPASIGLVLDVSGSMSWDDGAGTVRIAALNSTVNAFMSQMYTIVEEQLEDGETVANNNDIVRTAAVTYNSSVASTVPFDFDILSSSTISTILPATPEGGTNSSGAMTTMNQWMQGENAAHAANNGVDKRGKPVKEDEPEKYVIFMTDGVNNTTNYSNCRAADGHWHYYNLYTGEISESYRSGGGWHQVYALAHNEYAQYWSPPDFCDESSTYDAATIGQCNAMKSSQDVTIYSVGFALTPKEDDNQWRTAEIARATTLLNACASSNNHFFMADNAALLNQVFDGIGRDIIEDTIRIRK